MNNEAYPTTETNPTTAMIEACELTYTYDKEQNLALDGVNVRLSQGSFVAIIGPNASGKSTFARHCNALLLPMGGAVYVLGEACTASVDDSLKIRQNVGLVFQNPDNQMLMGVVEEDVAFGLCNLGLPAAEIEVRVGEALKAVDMADYRTCSAQRLSGGQKQKVALAGVLAMRPRCILLDEATAMLDPVGRQDILSILQHLRTDYGMTVVLITHNMDEAVLADRILVMSQGKIVLDGCPSLVFSHASVLHELGLALPPLTRLIYELEQAGCPVSTEVLTFEECEDMICQMLMRKTP